MRLKSRPIVADFFSFCKVFIEIMWISRGVLCALFTLLVLLSWVLTWAEPLGFWDSVYLSFITAFTIGYGDYVPITSLGKIVAIILGYIGLVFIGINVAIATIAVKETVTEDREIKDKLEKRKKHG